MQIKNIKQKDNSYELLRIFGKNIQEARLSKNITLEEVSLKTKIRVDYLKKIEKGIAKSVTAFHLFIIADALNIKPEKLVKDL